MVNRINNMEENQKQQVPERDPLHEDNGGGYGKPLND